MSPKFFATLVALLAFAPFAHAKFVVLPPVYESKQYEKVAKEMQSEGVLQAFADALNETLVVEPKLGLRFAECGQANAFYDADSKQVLMCFELLESYYESLADSYEKGEALDDAVANAFVFVFFHEIGHALVDVLELPVTGREEDAVDQLSAWVLIDSDEGDQAVLDGALSFYVFGDETDDDNDFSGEHSFNKQRYYNMVCWVYGSDPEKYEYLIGETEEDWLPKARAERCESEYAQLDRSWSKLLADHVVADEAEAEVEEEPEPATKRRRTPSGRTLGAGSKSSD